MARPYNQIISMTELSIDLRSSFKEEFGIDLDDIANVARGISWALHLATYWQGPRATRIPPQELSQLIGTLRTVQEQFELISLPLQDKARWQTSL
jgi:hypothetical protein